MNQIMHIMSEKDYKTFEQLVKLPQHSLKKVMSHWLSEKYENVVETKDYIYAIGDIPIALAAHMDTVFTKPVENLYYDTRKNVMWSSEGLGGDDRAGVFAILKILKTGLRPHIILSTDEERGCLGARELAKITCPFEDLRYIIQLDRHGTNDCVFYDCDNPEFVTYIEQYGFTEAFGSFTDITEYCPAWGVAGVNLSVGYFNEHSCSEVLFVNALYATINKVKRMLQETDIPKFEYIPFAYTSYYDYYDDKFWTYKSNSGTDIPETTTHGSYHIVPCDSCGEKEFEEDMFPVKGLNGKTKFFCPNCLTEKHVEWCFHCYEAVEREPNSVFIGKYFACPDCQKKLDEMKTKDNKPTQVHKKRGNK